MSRILVAVTPLAGHVVPMLPVAQRLLREGHQVFFMTADNFAAQVKAAGMQFLPLSGNANYNYHHLGEIIPELRTASTPIEQAIVYIKHVFADRIVDQYQALRDNIAKKSIDLVMTDVTFLGALPLLLGGKPRPPLIACGVIAPSWIDPAFSVFTGPNGSPEGRARNIEDNKTFLLMNAPGYRYIDGLLAQLGVAIPGGFNINSVYRLPDAFLQFGCEAFEFPMEERPRNLIYTGPIIHRRSDAEMSGWMAQLDRSVPIVLVSQGTLANFDFDQLVNPAILGLAGEPVQVVVTAGGSSEGKILSAKNAIVESYVPYEQILPMTSVFVTNGGYNGVQQALSYGVPIVCYGESEDKPLVAARVQWSGAGISLKPGTPMSEQIRNAVLKILHDPSYAERARILGAEITASDALQTTSQVVNETIAKAENSAKGLGSDNARKRGAPIVNHHDTIEWFNAIPGEQLSVRVHGTQVNGRYAMMENVASPGTATPMHFHAEDEIFHILEGTVKFSIDGDIVNASVGSIVVIPAGAHHAWRNSSNATIRMLTIFSPGGVEELYPKLNGLSPQEMVAVVERFGSGIVGPPIDE